MESYSLKSIAIFISGNGSNMESIIKECKFGILKDILRVVLVFSNKKDIKGIEKAQKLGIKTKIILSKGKRRESHEREIIDYLKNYNIDFIVLAGYMKILSPYIISKYKNKIINIHPADTILYKGINGYKWAYENSLKSTKITIHYVDEGIDTGEIISQKEVDLSSCKTLKEVKEMGLKIEHLFYPKILKRLINS